MTDWKAQNEDFERRFKKVQEQSKEMLAAVSKVGSDRAKLIECLENIMPSIDSVGVLEYVKSTLEEVKK